MHEVRRHTSIRAVARFTIPLFTSPRFACFIQVPPTDLSSFYYGSTCLLTNPDPDANPNPNPTPYPDPHDQVTLIKAEGFDFKKYSRCPVGMEPNVHRLFLDVWGRMPLMDIHGYPLWEKGVHDVVLANFVAMQRIFSHYTKGELLTPRAPRALTPNPTLP